MLHTARRISFQSLNTFNKPDKFSIYKLFSTSRIMQEKHSLLGGQGVTVTTTTGHTAHTQQDCCPTHATHKEPLIETPSSPIQRRTYASDQTSSQILDICAGHKHFREVRFPVQERKYSDLVKNGQHPKALFISCSDSRIIPDDLLNVGPGDLFVTRNVGAFVPPFETLLDGFSSVGAVIEFAVNALKVTDVIVCGHSDCGACAALHNPEFSKPREEVDDITWRNTAHLRNWLKLGAETREIVNQYVNDPKERTELTARVSVVLQIANLLTYPYIKEKVERNEINVHGWYYDIRKGVVEYYDPNKKRYYDTLDLERRGVPVVTDVDNEKPLRM